jgi:hypothetical protein
VALRAEVWVVDGRPRLHLRSCPEPHDRVVEPIDSAEAIELGFTPCATCKPVAALLAGQGSGGGSLTGWLMQTTELVDDEK